MTAEKFDRKELTHDPYRDAMFALVHYAYERRLWFVAAGAALVLLMAGLAGGYAYFQHSEQVEAEAWMQTLRALETKGGPEEQAKAATAAAQAFLDQHARSRLAPVAWLLLARTAWERQQLDLAGRAFQGALDHGKATALQRTEALVGLGKIKEAQGKPAEASALYQQIGDEFQDLKHLSLGRAAFLAGNFKEAREQYLQAAGAQGNSGITVQARAALDYLP